jgi:hypothetical protein
MKPSARGSTRITSASRLLPVALLVMVSSPLPTTAQTYCYNPTTDECYVSPEGFCRVYEGIPASRERCEERLRGRLAPDAVRCCYDAATDRAYKSRSECGALEQTISIETCNDRETRR